MLYCSKYFIIFLKFFYMDQLTPISQKTRHLSQYVSSIKHEIYFSHESTNYHPLKTIMINDPHPNTIGLSNSYWMDKSIPSTESAKSLYTLKPLCLHFLHVNLILEYFTFNSQFSQHEHHNNTIVLNQNLQQENEE